MDITVDTSAIMAVVLNEGSKRALIHRTKGHQLGSAPTLPWEVGNALSALLRRRRLDPEQAQGALESFRRIPVRLLEVGVEDAVALAGEQGIYAYDAYILECARRYRTPLLSLDNQQIAIARDLGIEVLEV